MTLYNDIGRKSPKDSGFFFFGIDGAFSINDGLELLGVAGPVCRAGSMYNLQLAHKGWTGGGVSTASLMPKSVSFL